MSNVFIIGATGKIGKRLSPMLVSADSVEHEATNSAVIM